MNRMKNLIAEVKEIGEGLFPWLVFGLTGFLVVKLILVSVQ